MKVRDLLGNVSKWKMTHNENMGVRSKLHLSVRNLVQEVYPTARLIEEVTIHPRPRETLYIDFYLPLHKLAIEVHGQQHYAFSTLYHNSRQDFLAQKTRDRDKEAWCSINNIQLVILPYHEGLDEWRSKLS